MIDHSSYSKIFYKLKNYLNILSDKINHNKIDDIQTKKLNKTDNQS